MNDHAAVKSFWERESSRGQVLKGAAGLTGAALAAGVGLPGGASGVEDAQARTNAEPRPSGAKFVLELDGKRVGLLRSVEGGRPRADVAEEAPGEGGVSKKHVAAVRYDDLVIETGLHPPILELIGNSWAGKSEPINGAIIKLDGSGVAKEELQFSNAILTETTFPAFDASSKSAGYLTLALKPEVARLEKGDGSKPSIGNKQKAWLVSNFRFGLKGVDGTKVGKIDKFSVRREVLAAAKAFEPGKLEVPNLLLTISAASEASWRAWEQAFLIDGKNGDGAEKFGEITILGADFKAVLARVSLEHVGLVSVEDERQETNSEALARLRAELYVERMELTQG
jgi:hypothetical protein